MTDYDDLNWIYVGDLSPDAKEALFISVEKFRAGAKEHGPLDVLSKEWEDSILEELIDERHYLIFELMKRKKLRGA